MLFRSIVKDTATFIDQELGGFESQLEKIIPEEEVADITEERKIAEEESASIAEEIKAEDSMVTIPANAFVSGDSWKCNAGFRKSSSENNCIKKIKIPLNAYATSSASNGWKCGYLYYKSNDSCFKLPSNAIKKINRDGFNCDNGYKRIGNSCKPDVPKNASASGDSWKCNAGFYKNNNNCVKLPLNAIAKGYEDGYICIKRYKKISNKCVSKITNEESKN